MRALALGIAGMGLGALAAAITLPACGCPSGDGSVTPLQSGTYILVGDGGDANYQLVIAADRKTVTETYVHGGFRYEVRYDVTQDGPR